MMDDLEEINRKVLDVLDDLHRLFTRRANEAARSVLDPVLQGVLKGMGIDLSQLQGMMSGQMAVDPYRILGLDKSASDEEVKKRYRERLRQFHPDTAGPGMEFHLQAVLAAYELIRRERGWG